MIVLLACFPKSGSTFLSDLIASQPDFQRAELTPSFGRREQEIEEGLVAKCAGHNCVAQHHVRASEHTCALIDKYRITPIVLVRNVADSLVSLADHIERESPATPVAFFDEAFLQIDPAKRQVAVAELAAPWYINFYVSWWRARPQAIVRYEDVVLAGRLDLVEARIGRRLKMPSGLLPRRYNVGIEGRGAGIAHVPRKLMDHYPDVDFAPIS